MGSAIITRQGVMDFLDTPIQAIVLLNTMHVMILSRYSAYLQAVVEFYVTQAFRSNEKCLQPSWLCALCMILSVYIYIFVCAQDTFLVASIYFDIFVVSLNHPAGSLFLFISIEWISQDDGINVVWNEKHSVLRLRLLCVCCCCWCCCCERVKEMHHTKKRKKSSKQMLGGKCLKNVQRLLSRTSWQGEWGSMVAVTMDVAKVVAMP